MHIHCLQHVSFETPATILEWAGAHDVGISYTYFFNTDYVLPALADFDVLLIMGGYMNVAEEERFPWLKQEKEFIADAINAGKKILGICLGSQLIASVLRCSVYPGSEKEIGFFPVRFSDAAQEHPLFNHFDSPYTLFHWHGDTFDLPENASLLASTDVCKHQAYFIPPNILALQFHLEMNEEAIEQMLLHDGAELNEKGRYIQDRAEIRSNYLWLDRNREDMFVLLDKFLDSSAGPIL